MDAPNSPPDRSAPALPFYSIVVPLYDKRAFIGATLDSVAAQSAWSRLAFEIVVVDDGSRDDGAAVVEAWHQRHPVALTLLRRRNAGVAAARNDGIAHARGQWVLCLDADDLLEPSFFDTIDAMRRAHPDATVLATGYAGFRSNGGAFDALRGGASGAFGLPRVSGVQGESGVPVAPGTPGAPAAPVAVESIDDLPQRWVRQALLYVCSTVVRRDVLDALQPCFPPGERCGEDLSLLFRLNHRQPVVYTAQPLVRYRLDDAGSLSSSVSTATLRAFWARITAEFERDSAGAVRRASLQRFIAHAHVLRADALLRQVPAGPAGNGPAGDGAAGNGVGGGGAGGGGAGGGGAGGGGADGGGAGAEARALLAEVPAALRTRYWWRTRAAAAWPLLARWRSLAFFEDLSVAQEGLLSLGFWALQVYRLGHLRYRFASRWVRYPLGVVHLVLAKLMEMASGITIGVAARIGRRLVIEHSGGIVVHGATVIGDDCRIRQGVTLGNRHLDDPAGAPVLGDRVNVGAGAKILGRVRLGDGAQVGANAVVLHDVAAGESVGGIPARPIRRRSGAPAGGAVARRDAAAGHDAVASRDAAAGHNAAAGHDAAASDDAGVPARPAHVRPASSSGGSDR